MPNTTNNKLTPSLTEALEFIKALTGSEDTPMVFQTFDDQKDRKKKELTRILTGTLTEHAETLVRLNQDGAGIFVQINEGSARGANNITAIRGVFVDKDDGDLAVLKLEPSMLVQTKHGQHAYWRLAPGAEIDKFTPMQKTLIQQLGTDKSVHNVDRVMRLPGFYHQKTASQPFLITIKLISDREYTLDEVAAAYPISERATSGNCNSKQPEREATEQVIRSFQRWANRQSIAEGERNSTLVKIVREGLGQGIDQSTLNRIVLEYCSRSGLPDVEGVVILKRHIVEHQDKPFVPYQDLSNPPMYEVIEGKIHWNKPTQDGPVPTAICNFSAEILEEVTHDDGLEVKKYFKLRGISYDGRLFPEITITAEDFNSDKWPTAYWGVDAIVFVGKDKHLRVAIQTLSAGKVNNSVIYRHTGWRKINDEYYYLTNTGTIGTNGLNSQVEVDLGTSRMADYSLPEPPIDRESLRRAVAASLETLKVGPPEITCPLLAATYRAPLNECLPSDFSMFVYGTTGSFKSSAVGVFLNHYGPNFSYAQLPDNWASTENALEKKSHDLKDCLFVIDEWTVNGTSSDAIRLNAKAERVLRGQGNQSGRGRMTSACEMRPAYYSRGIIVSTGEDAPRGQSLRARMFMLQISPGDIDKTVLTHCQRQGSHGYLSQAMAAYIQSLASQIPFLKKRMPRLHARLRRKIESSNMHSRVPGIAANLGLGLWYFLRFALQVKSIRHEERRLLWHEGWSAITRAAEKQAALQADENEVSRFIGYIRSGLNTKSAYLSHISSEPSAIGVQIGWYSEGEEIYLDPDAAYTFVQRQALSQHAPVFPSKQTLWKRLAEKNLILTDPNERRNLLKRQISTGRRQHVLVFPNSRVFFGYESDDDKGGAA